MGGFFMYFSKKCIKKTETVFYPYNILPPTNWVALSLWYEHTGADDMCVIISN